MRDPNGSRPVRRPGGRYSISMTVGTPGARWRIRRMASEPSLDTVPERFALFVGTVEGRKNHKLVFDIWRRMVEEGEEPPYLVCVGRVGWRSEPFIADLVETQNLGGRIILLQDVSDAQLRLLYVEPTTRGLGIGTHLVDECVEFARRAGYRKMTLWTNSVLDSARRIYQRKGFLLIKEERHHSFGKNLVGQNWELDLRTG